MCGCFLVINDAPQRIQSHLEGKQHMGYARIRSKIEELQVSELWCASLLIIIPGTGSGRSQSTHPARLVLVWYICTLAQMDNFSCACLHSLLYMHAWRTPSGAVAGPGMCVQVSVGVHEACEPRIAALVLDVSLRYCRKHGWQCAQIRSKPVLLHATRVMVCVRLV